MSSSLRDQLVKAGLASKQSANSLNAKSRKKHKKPAQKTAADAAAQKAAEEKRERDKALNAAIQEKQQKAAIKGQIKALIEASAIKDYNGEKAYSYISSGKVRQMFVTAEVHTQLSSDKLGITRLNGKTYLVPVDTADKIVQLNPDWAMTRPGRDAEKPTTEDDPYADYQVPDDITW